MPLQTFLNNDTPREVKTLHRQWTKALLLLFIAACLSGCLSTEKVPPETTEISQGTTLETQSAPTTIPTAPTEATTPSAPATEPLPSLCIPGLSVDEVITYFNEVCLDAEFVDGGDASLLQKWTVPIYYMVHGEPTAEDTAVFGGFTAWLNTIEGFPGIYEAQDAAAANLQIYFCKEQELLDRMGDPYIGTDGAVTFWYSNNEIYSAIICYRTEIPQVVRNSVILEELYNGLGPVQDTTLRDDSIIYSGYSEPQALTPVDELLLKLLYHPRMICGMDAEECEAIIRQLYY